MFACNVPEIDVGLPTEIYSAIENEIVPHTPAHDKSQQMTSFGEL